MATSFKISQIINKALYDENIGYYKTKNPLGINGDFVTSPEISQIFGEIIASYILYIFSSKITSISLVEMGAGRGFLMRDIIQTIDNLAKNGDKVAKNFFEKVDFNIIEINPVLIDVQKKNLAHFSNKLFIKWHKNIDEFLYNKNIEIFFISNELLDCFAIDQFVKTDIGWCERLIEFDDDKNFVNPRFKISKFNQNIHDFIVDDLGFELSSKARINSTFEYCADAREFYKKICQYIQKNDGIMINCDYGYYNYDFANSLQAIKDGKKIPILEAFFGADITAHVDFFALDKITKNFNLKSSLISQRQFLLDLGAEERMYKLIEFSPNNAQEIRAGFERIVSKEQMGELFKFHIVWR